MLKNRFRGASSVADVKVETAVDSRAAGVRSISSLEEPNICAASFPVWLVF